MTKTQFMAQKSEKYKVESHRGYVILKDKEKEVYVDTYFTAEWEAMK